MSALKARTNGCEDAMCHFLAREYSAARQRVAGVIQQLLRTEDEV